MANNLKVKTIKKYYTLEGLSEVYDNYELAKKEKDQVFKKEKMYPLGFQYEEEAKALQRGVWKEYVEETVIPYETDADAVIYADGSVDEVLKEGAYGLVIFFKNGDVFYESAWLKDSTPQKYRIVRYTSAGEMQELEAEYQDIFAGKEVPQKDHAYISASRNIGSECDSVMRGLDICVKERGLKKIVIAYDCEIVETVWKNRNAKTNVSRKYANYCNEIEAMGVTIEWIKVDSHSAKKNKPQYALENKNYIHSVYNDLVDAIAKAEMADKPIGISENFNLARAILPKTLLSFDDYGAKTKEQRRAYARDLLHMVLDNEVIRPRFK